MKNTKSFITFFSRLALCYGIVWSAFSCSSYSQSETGNYLADAINQSETLNRAFESDAQFLINMAEVNLEQIMLGQLAQHNASLPETRNLGLVLETSYMSLQQKLVTLARDKSIVIPLVATDKSKDIFKELSKSYPPDFDSKYCQTIIDNHNETISMVEKTFKETSDIKTEAFAFKSIPILNEHLRLATRCLKNTQTRIAIKDKTK